MINEITILLSKENKLLVTGCIKDDSNPIPIRLISLLGKCGYILSPDFQGLISPDYEIFLLNTLNPWLGERHGLGRRWKTVWEVPAEIPESLEEQKGIQGALYMCPELLEKLHESKQDIPEFWKENHWNPTKVLTPGYISDITRISESLLSSPLPLGDSDKSILKFLLESGKHLITVPSKIPVKETLAMALCYGIGVDKISGITDILRVASYLSNGDTTLGRRTRFHLSRKEREIVMKLLEDYFSKTPFQEWYLMDAKKYEEQWKILGYHCHPSPKKYPHVFHFFELIRKVPLRSWWSYIQSAYDARNYQLVINRLLQRPSEFIRRYDSLLRKAWEDRDAIRLDSIQEGFLEIRSGSVSEKVLFELYRYYDRRGKEIPRSFLDKKGIRHTYSSLPGLPQELIDIAQTNIIRMIRRCWKLKDTYSGKKVCVSSLPEGLGFSLSFRGGVTDQTEPMYPGQKIEFPTTGIIRFFSQWYDPKGDEDLDIHAWLIDDDKILKSISWNTRFTDPECFVTHSGDIRHQPGDCAEYVTVDYSKDFSYTWMLITVQNYDGDCLKDVENWIGVSQILGNPEETGWIPSKNDTLFRGKVTSEAKNMSAFIVNLKEGWAKLLLEGVEANVLSNQDLIKQYITSDTLDVKSLVSWYIQDTGGEIVETPEEADTILSLHNYMSGEIHNLLLG